jgi:hypothetical protein
MIMKRLLTKCGRSWEKKVLQESLGEIPSDKNKKNFNE